MAKVLLKNVRLSFPDLWKPADPFPGSSSGSKFGAQFIFAPDSDAAAIAQAEFKRVAAEKFGKNAPAILAELAKDKKCIRRGDANLDKDGNVRAGYAGMLYLSAKNKARPLVVGLNKSQLTEADGKPYGGCYVNASVDIYAQDKPGQGKSVNATLLAVQFFKDGDAFGGGVGTADDFEDLGETADEDLF